MVLERPCLPVLLPPVSPGPAWSRVVDKLRGCKESREKDSVARAAGAQGVRGYMRYSQPTVRKSFALAHFTPELGE